VRGRDQGEVQVAVSRLWPGERGRALTHRANKGVAEDSKAPSAGAKSLCIPFDQEQYGPFPDGEAQKCVQCGKKAKSWTLFGRSEPRRGLVRIELTCRLLDGRSFPRWSRRVAPRVACGGEIAVQGIIRSFSSSVIIVSPGCAPSCNRHPLHSRIGTR
jgi:hypothetical protein